MSGRISHGDLSAACGRCCSWARGGFGFGTGRGKFSAMMGGVFAVSTHPGGLRRIEAGCICRCCDPLSTILLQLGNPLAQHVFVYESPSQPCPRHPLQHCVTYRSNRLPGFQSLLPSAAWQRPCAGCRSPCPPLAASSLPPSSVDQRRQREFTTERGSLPTFLYSSRPRSKIRSLAAVLSFSFS